VITNDVSDSYQEIYVIVTLFVITKYITHKRQVP